MNEGTPVPPAFLGGIVRFARSLKADIWALRLIPAFSTYVVVWSYISTLRFYALHATVNDLGLETQVLWNLSHPEGFNTVYYLLMVLAHPFQFLLSPLSLPLSYPLLFVVQSLGLGSGAFAVYGISRRVFENPAGSYCLSLAYLLYFPLGGVNWFDFHAQAFFVPLFLWGFFCYLTRRYRFAFVLFLLAAGTTYSYVLLVGLFSVLTLFEMALRRVRFKERPDSSEWKFAVVLLVASTAFFIFQFAYFFYVLGISFAVNAQIVAGPVPVGNRAEVIALLLLPMLFLPALAPKWLVMLLPFSYLELTSAADPLSFPGIFQIQFTALAIPFVFIGTTYGIRTVDRLRTRAQRELEGRPRQRFDWYFRRPPRTTGLATAVLAVTVACATVFQPYGPLNQAGPDSFGAATATDVNWTYFGQLSHLANLISTSARYVLIQNSMPSTLPRPLSYTGGSPIVTGFEHWLNVTVSDAASNRYALEGIGGTHVFLPLNFAISDPNNEWYTFGDNVSMFRFFTTMYQSGYYGLMGEASGMTVLARGYNGSLEYYEPFSEVISSTDLYSGGTQALSSGPFLTRSNLTGQTAWYGPYTALSPGTYRVGISLMTSNILPKNSLSLMVLADGASTLLANQSVAGGNFTRPGVWTMFNLTVRLTTAYADLEFAGWYASWQGSVSIRSISVNEIAPPRSMYAGSTVPGVPTSLAVPS